MTKKKRPDWAALMPYATPKQADALTAMVQCGSIAQAAARLKIPATMLRNHLAEVQRAAARRGWSPAHDMTETVPAGYHVKGVSTYYDKHGIPKGQWVKSQKDQDHQYALLMDAMQSIVEPIRGKAQRIKAPKRTDKDLLCVYPMGDPHLGMFSWAKETGQDFDLETAERDLVSAVDTLVDGAPDAREALIINLGDFFHSDNTTNRTMRSGNILDVDTRWAKLLSVGIRTMRRVIDRALERHDTVRVICEIGNHDDHSSIMLAICLANYYENNPRVRVDTSPAHFHWYRFGTTLIGTTHGDKVKLDKLPGIMAVDRREDWGETLYRYFYVGHVHHDQAKEYPGCVVETFRTLAPNDAWAHGAGYRSEQDMKCDVIHRQWGRERRNTVGIRRIRAG